MKVIQKNTAIKADKEFPGCLGRMVNLFDLSAGPSATRLLKDKPHSNEEARRLDTFPGNKLEDKMEMSEESKSWQGSPNVVAKLMGLDAVPQQQLDVVMLGAHSKDYSKRILSHSGKPTQYWAHECDFLDKQMKWKAHDDESHNDYRDFYEIRKEYQRMNSLTEELPQRGIYSEKEEKKKMKLVRQKFMEAKRLATNEKLCQSKEFQDAVDVLSSNKEFFLKFLQEPSALVSKHLYELQSICAPPETKRITVLKPSKMVSLEKFPIRGKKNDYPIKRPAQVVQETYLNYDADKYDNQPTRIVVLKPNAGKMCQIKSSVSVASSLPGILHGENTSEAELSRSGESRQVVQENIFHIHRKLMDDWGDEILTSAALGNKTPFNKSVESYNDFEVMSPNTWHSRDCLNVCGSPFSSSFFSRKSYSLDSSACREATKRLSERWAMMASSGASQQGRCSQRSSNTLAEMLALSDTKKSIKNEEGDERGVGTSSILDKRDIDMPVYLQRSKSLPASSTEYDKRTSLEPLDHEARNTNSLKEPTKKSAASSFKGKFSSFFLSRNKRMNKDKYSPSQSSEELPSSASHAAESSVSAYPHKMVTHSVNQYAKDSQLGECLSPVLGFLDRSFPDSTEMGQKQGVVPQEGEISNLKPALWGDSTENTNQPRPVSILELPYGECDTATPESSGKQLPGHPLMSDSISKSLPVESIARTLSWDDSCLGSVSPNQSEIGSFEMVEQDWFILVREILSSAGLDEEIQWDTFLFDWRSPENPLNVSQLDTIMSVEGEGSLHKSKRLQQRSNRKLVFDCVNEALFEVVGHGIDPTSPQYPVIRSGEPQSTVLDRVWTLVRGWLSCNVARDDWDGHILAVEMAVRDEVVVRRGQWTNDFGLEIGKFVKEIEQELLQELVVYALVDLL